MVLSEWTVRLGEPQQAVYCRYNESTHRHLRRVRNEPDFTGKWKILWSGDTEGHINVVLTH